MKIVFFSFYYPPDLCAGSFRAFALTKALSYKLSDKDELHVITTHPNRYASHQVLADDLEIEGNITVHRILVPKHNGGMLAQARIFLVYARSAITLSNEIEPEFIIGTTGRLMTGVVSWWTARRMRCNYFIDLRDIFSETISDLFAKRSALLGWISKQFFSYVEKRVLINAMGVNVVSEGFPAYFQENGIDTQTWSFYPNGVDSEFIGVETAREINEKRETTILYAGNIGSGQGLERIVPELAKSLGEDFHLVVIGDGGTKRLLSEALVREGINNVELLPPVSRDKLLDHYRQADLLFLHLNDVPAFQRVLPSKIFEYVSLGKPVVAGLSGYSAQFLKDHVPYAALFTPGDSLEAANAVRKAMAMDISQPVVDRFVEKFSRVTIMDKMADRWIGKMGRQ